MQLVVGHDRSAQTGQSHFHLQCSRRILAGVQQIETTSHHKRFWQILGIVHGHRHLVAHAAWQRYLGFGHGVRVSDAKHADLYILRLQFRYQILRLFYKQATSAYHEIKDAILGWWRQFHRIKFVPRYFEHREIEKMNLHRYWIITEIFDLVLRQCQLVDQYFDYVDLLVATTEAGHLE